MEHLQVGSIGNSGKLHPGKFCKIVLQPLEIPRPRIKTYGNSTWFLLDHPWKFHFFLNWPLEFLHALSSILSWKFDVLNPCSTLYDKWLLGYSRNIWVLIFSGIVQLLDAIQGQVQGKQQKSESYLHKLQKEKLN